MEKAKINSRREFIKNSAASLAAFSILPLEVLGGRSTSSIGLESSTSLGKSVCSEQQPIRLLVRADDMGKTYDRNLAFIKTHKEGIVTSSSLMATSRFFEEAVEMCKETPTMAIGVHTTIRDSTQRPVLSPGKVPSLVGPKGFFYDTAEELAEANPCMKEMEMEIRAQVEKVRASGLHFVYVDNHRGGGCDDIILKICKEQKLVYGRCYDGTMYGYVRTSFIPEKFPNTILPDGQRVYYGAPRITAEEQEKSLEHLNNLQPGNWIMVVHPGLAEPNRGSVTELVCSPGVKEIIRRKNIQLVSYYDFWKEEYG